jgi:hypothetical protein
VVRLKIADRGFESVTIFPTGKSPQHVRISWIGHVVRLHDICRINCKDSITLWPIGNPLLIVMEFTFRFSPLFLVGMTGAFQRLAARCLPGPGFSGNVSRIRSRDNSNQQFFHTASQNLSTVHQQIPEIVSQPPGTRFENRPVATAPPVLLFPVKVYGVFRFRIAVHGPGNAQLVLINHRCPNIADVIRFTNPINAGPWSTISYTRTNQARWLPRSRCYRN